MLFSVGMNDIGSAMHKIKRDTEIVAMRVLINDAVVLLCCLTPIRIRTEITIKGSNAAKDAIPTEILVEYSQFPCDVAKIASNGAGIANIVPIRRAIRISLMLI